VTDRRGLHSANRSRRDSRRGGRPLVSAGALVAGVLVLLALVVTGVLLLGGRAPTTTAVRLAPAASVTTLTTAATLSISASESAPSAEPTASASSTEAPRPAPHKVDLVIAWQPSHQNDTGKGYHEYVVCGDIVDRAMAKLTQFTNVKAWDLKHGLTGSNNFKPTPKNTPAFDVELATANKAHADVFVAVHNDGGAPSGVLGEYLPGDVASQALCKKMVASICARTGLRSRGVRAVRLYSFETVRNKAKYKVLLEIGDNAADLKFLMSSAKRDLAAQAMADVLAKEFAAGR
jgi:hypothetical protein